MSNEQKRAILIIKNYLNKDLEDNYILDNYSLAIDLLIEKATKLQSIKTPGVKSMSEGGQSITFSDGEAWSITEDIKSLLPTPYTRMC